MAKDWIARSNSDFLAQARNFSQQINADPQRYSVDPAEAAMVAAQFEAFNVMYRATTNPDIRSRSGTRARNDARKTLAGTMRDLGGRIRANRSISDMDKTGLSLTIPKRDNRPMVALPALRPIVFIRSLVQNILTLSVYNTDSASISKPKYVTGAEVYFATGDQEPQDPRDWQRGCITMSSKAKIFLPLLAPGTQLWICARWFNVHGAGPASNWISTHVASMTTGPGAAGSTRLLAA